MNAAIITKITFYYFVLRSLYYYCRLCSDRMQGCI